MLATILLILLTSFTITLSGQVNWTIEKCIEQALQNNLELALQDNSNELADIELLQSKHNFGPNINGRMEYLQSYGRSIDPTTNAFRTLNTRANTVYLSNSIDVFSGMQKWNALKKSQLLAESGELNRDILEESIQLNVLTAYLSVIRSKEQLQQLTRQRDITEEQLIRTESMVDAGVLARNELIALEAQLAGDNSLLVQAENQIDLGLTELKLLMRLDPDSLIEVVVPDLPELTDLETALDPIEAIYEYALVNRPEILNYELNEILSDYDTRIAKGAYYPRLSFFSTLGTTYSNKYKDFDVNIDFQEQVIGALASDPSETVIGQIPVSNTVISNVGYLEQLESNLSFAMGLTMNIPLFNRNTTRLNLSRTAVLSEQSKLYTEQAKLNLYNTIQQAYSQALAALEGFKAASANLEAASRSLDSERSKLEAGTGTNLEFNIASNRWSIASSRKIEAKYDYIFFTKYLEVFQGKPISF